jgi:hypothetical protein
VLIGQGCEPALDGGQVVGRLVHDVERPRGSGT